MRWSDFRVRWLGVSALLVASPCLAAEATGGGPASKTERPQPPDANTCLACHLTLSEARLSAVAKEYQTSVHRDERIGCAGCHGGTPTDPTVRAHDAAASFVARPARHAIAELCGGCHSDPVFVRRFNARLPVDQKRLFELSVHGRLSSGSDPKAPTCSDCHGAHGVLPVDASDSPVNSAHVVELCARCHADRKYMQSYGTPTDQVEAWRASSHGMAARAGNSRAPTCTGCHSPHAGTLETFSAAALCGRCHEEQRRLFMASPHAKPFRRLGLAECIPCHGDHDVASTSWLMGMSPEAACSRCHRKNERGGRVAIEIAQHLRTLDSREHRVRAGLANAGRDGLFAPDAELALARVRSGRLELAAKVHDLDLEHLGSAGERLGELTKHAERAIDASRRARVVEMRGYYAAIFVCALLCALLVVKAIRLSRERAGREK